MTKQWICLVGVVPGNAIVLTQVPIICLKSLTQRLETISISARGLKCTCSALDSLENAKESRESASKTCLVSAHLSRLNDLRLAGTAKSVLIINRNQRPTTHSIYRCSARLRLDNNSFELWR